MAPRSDLCRHDAKPSEDSRQPEIKAGIYDLGLGQNAANYTPLTPFRFMARTAGVFRDLPKTSTGKIQKIPLCDHTRGTEQQG